MTRPDSSNVSYSIMFTILMLVGGKKQIINAITEPIRPIADTAKCPANPPGILKAMLGFLSLNRITMLAANMSMYIII